MSIEIAYTNLSRRPQRPPQPGTHVNAKMRFMRRITALFGIGSNVLVNGAAGKIIGYNISDFGRWLSISHPLIVQLDTGEILFSPSSEVAQAVNKRPFF